MEPYLGDIRMFAGNFAPRDYSFCNGSLLPISSNTALFSLLGTIYGGDGTRVFALPDLRGRVPVHRGTATGSSVNFPMGYKIGTESVSLTADQLPPHRHDFKVHDQDANSQDPAGNAVAKGTFYTSANNVTDAGGVSQHIMQESGGGSPHNNMMPYLGINFIIALQGVFPSRN